MSNQANALATKVSTPAIQPASGLMLQRKCACGGSSGLSGECDDCQNKRLQRKSAGTEPADVPPIVHEVLRSPGQPLDAEARRFFEPRFGHDFSQVRVHRDASAAESARAVSALAYTVGRNIVFGAAQYSPHTDAGRSLLAHELTHVVQQHHAPAPSTLTISMDSASEAEADRAGSALPAGREPSWAGMAPSLQRKPVSEGACSDDAQRQTVEAAYSTARRWITPAMQGLNINMKTNNNPNMAITMFPDVEVGLQMHFHINSLSPLAGRVLNNLRSLSAGLNQPPPLICGFECSGDNAHFDPNRRIISFCKPFFDEKNPSSQAHTLLHELAHASIPSITRGMAKDQSLRSQRAYALLSPDEAVDNADSYASFLQDVNSRRPVKPGVPADAVQSCTGPEFPNGAADMARRALARAEQRNLTAVSVLLQAKAEHDPTAGPLLKKYFGNAERVTNALAVYMQAKFKLASAIRLECDKQCTAPEFGYNQQNPRGDVLHLCPSWFSEKNEQLRIEWLHQALLRSYTRDNIEAAKLAQFAGEITAAILGSTTTAPPTAPSTPMMSEEEFERIRKGVTNP